MKWQPIETAPKEIEFRCLLAHQHSIVIGYWDGDGWRNERSRSGRYYEPTHWMPLPAIPDIGNNGLEEVVQQQDRQAAASVIGFHGRQTGVDVEILAGQRDEHPLVQAFYSHRQKSPGDPA